MNTDGMNMNAKLELVGIREDLNNNHFWEEDETIWKKEKQKTDIEKEAERYERLLFCMKGENLDLFLEWDTDRNGKGNLRCYYDIKKGETENDAYITLKKNYEDINKDSKITEEDLVPNKKEYNEFFMKNNGNGIFILGKDEDGDGIEDKRYLYSKKGLGIKEDTIYIQMELVGIQKDLNKDAVFGDNELIWKKSNKEIPPAQRPPAPIEKSITEMLI